MQHDHTEQNGRLACKGEEFVAYDVIFDAALQAIFLYGKHMQNFIYLRLACAQIMVFIKDSR